MDQVLAALQSALEGRYVIERELGRGGMATVHLARDLKHARPVALKVLHPDLAATLGPERFLREVRLTASLQHPHILPVHDSGSAAGQLWYTMPFVEGESLRERLNREKQLPLEDALQIARNVLAALGYAHSHGVVHRDIKPENILLEAGEAVVADFGIARAIAEAGGEHLTQTGMAVGTPAYMSPEQAAGGEVDGRSDLYSAGCVLYEMLAGEPPYTGPTPQAILAKRVLEPVPHLRTLRESVPEAVEQAVTKALAKVPADRFATASQFAEVLSLPLGRGGMKPKLRVVFRSRRVRLGLVATLVGLLGTVAVLSRPTRANTLDPDLLAVAPFDVLDPRLELWHEGLVDVLSRNLDGTGPLRTVPPTTVIRRWRGRADPLSAEMLGRRTGARLAIYGSLVGSGTDSVRLNVTLLDVTTHRPLLEVDLRGAEKRMDGVVDSLTLRLLRELGRTRPIGAVRLTALGSASLPALKAFLRGEQYFRRTTWDSAIAAYTQAIGLDSTFAPAFRQLGRALGWQRIGGDSLAIVNELRAGTLNHGLASRDSLLITADSLLAALFQPDDTLWWAHTRRLFATLAVATQHYPDDPDAWYDLGDARFHFGAAFGVTLRQQLDPFDRAIALDSSFAPAYIHAVALGLQAGGLSLGRRYVAAYLAQHPTDVNAAGIRLAARLLAADQARVPELMRQLDTLPADPLFFAWYAVMRWTDSAETAVRLARAFFRARQSSYTGFEDSFYRRFVLSRELAFRGHWREANAVMQAEVGDQPSRLFTEMALHGMLPAESAAAVFARWRRSPVPLFDRALPWWGMRGDTLPLRSVVRQADSAARFRKSSAEREAWVYTGALALAYLTLARRDTAAAISRFVALPDSLCQACYLHRLTGVELLTAADRHQEAATLLENLLHGDEYPHASDVLWALARGRLDERLGQREAALSAYQFVVEAWHGADQELQPYVSEAREGMKRLVREPRR